MALTLILALLFQVSNATVPAHGKPFLTVDGKGVQIYRCTQEADGFKWAFVSPEAVLFDQTTHQQLGTHGAGPSWVWNDGSSVTGVVAERTPAADPADVPWLLLKAQPDQSHPGVLSRTTLVRRYATHGGSAPASGCDADHADMTLRVPYTATYAFYFTAPH